MAANSLENLVTLCKECHKLVEKRVRIKSGLSGLSYLLGHLAPLFLMCDARDIGIHWEPQNSFYNNLPIIMIYEEIPAGIGFSERLFDVHVILLKTSKDTLLSCKCEDGCPSCVGPGGIDGAGSKQTTLALLEELLSYA